MPKSVKGPDQAKRKTLIKLLKDEGMACVADEKNIEDDVPLRGRGL
jgi:hypothetical protein